MSTILYRGFNEMGNRISGSKNFGSEAQMKEYLDKHGIYGYEIFESKTTHKRGMYSIVSPKELSIFCKQISVLFYSHITLMEGVLALEEQTDNKQLRIALGEIYNFMQEGYSFADAMCMYDHIFSVYLLDMVVIGETSGTLDTVFSRMSSYFDKESKIRKKVRSAVTYPAVLASLMIAIIVLLIVKILPMFGNILESMGSEMPSSTNFILHIGTLLSIYAPIGLAVIAIIVIACLIYIRTEKGKFTYDRLKLSIPAYRYVYSRVVTSRFSRSLAILLRSGVQLLNALTNVSTLMNNRYLQAQLEQVVDKVNDGQDLTELLKEMGIFPALFIKMFIIGQKTGNLDEMLEKSASVFDDEVDDAVERFTSMLEPILIIILSIIVGAILLSVMLPMINIMNTIG